MASNLLTKSAWTVLSRRSTVHISKILSAAASRAQTQLISTQNASVDSKFKFSSQRRSLSTTPTSATEPPIKEQKPVEEKINNLNPESQNTDSGTNSESQFDEDEVKRTILLKALGHVPKNGFTMEALEHGKDRGFGRRAFLDW